ncbi:MAG: hypothetical protein ACFE75_03665 [Candidatus Hodarchaeota archaeon]
MKEEKNVKVDKVIKRIKRMAGRATLMYGVAEWDKCLEIIKQGEDLIRSFPGNLPKELEEPHCWLLIQKMNIAVNRGYLSHGFEITNELLTVAEKYGIKKNIVIAFNNLGTYYWKIGEYDKSLAYIDRGLMLIDEVGEVRDWASIVAHINMISLAMNVAIDKVDLELARKYFNNIKDILALKPEDSVLNIIYKLNEARFLQTSKRFRDKVRAEELYKKVIEGPFTNNVLKLEALVGLCESLLIELIISNEVDIVNEMKPYIEQLINLSQQWESDYYLMEAYILKGKLALLIFEIKTARRILIQAQRIAERRGFKDVAVEIGYLHEDLKGKLETWKQLKIMDAPLSERIELAGLDNLAKGQFRKKIRRMERVTEEEVIVYKDSHLCLVCKGNVGGFNVFICQQCKSIYCRSCAKAVIEIENACWTCENPIDISKPIMLDKPEQRDVKKKN